MKVKCTMFKTTSKYYTDGEYETDREFISDIWQEVRKMRDERRLPGLVKGHSYYIVSVDIPEHHSNHPHLIV